MMAILPSTQKAAESPSCLKPATIRRINTERENVAQAAQTGSGRHRVENLDKNRQEGNGLSTESVR